VSGGDPGEAGDAGDVSAAGSGSVAPGQSGLPEPARLARAALSRLAEPGDVALARAVRDRGPVEVFAAVQAGNVADLDADVAVDPDSHQAVVPGGPGAALARRLAGYRARLADADPADLLLRAERCGIRLVCPGEPEWPTQLDQLGEAERGRRGPLVPPLCLWIRGEADLRLAALRSVAVIGARAASAYGEHVAAELAAGLTEGGWTVVSGAAYGVDGAAHRGALAVGGSTVAALACGVDVAYPRGHDALLGRIARTGAVFSELPPGAAVTRSRLLQRNRLVAALTRGTVVVEAALRSGTASTATTAIALGRPVMAVPGPVTAATSAGCHELVRDGRAVLVTDAADIVDVVGRLGADGAASRRGQERPEDAVTAVELRVLDALPVRRGVGVARLARTSGLDLSTVREALGGLLAAGLAEPDAGGYRVGVTLRGRRQRGPVAAEATRAHDRGAGA
jgi:DNA processing protein